METRKFTEEIKMELVERYAEGERMKDLCAEYKVDLSAAYKWLKAYGVDCQNPHKTHKGNGRRSSKRTCPKCGNADNNVKAQYCYICGAKLKTEAELLIDELSWMRGLTQYLPQAMRDRALLTINKSINYIKETEKRKAVEENGNDLR